MNVSVFNGRLSSLFSKVLLLALLSIPSSAWAFVNITLSASNVTSANPGPGTTFTLSWTPTSDGNSRYLYEWDPNGTMRTLNNGNASTPVTLTRTGVGAWRYRVVFGRPKSNGQIQATGQSNDLTIQVVPATPTLSGPSRPPVDNAGFRMNWTSGAGDFIYQLVESRQLDFSGTNVEYWPSIAGENIPAKAPGVYYYHVRAWNKLPQNGGIAGSWSNTITVNVLSDDAFLDMLGRKTFDYMLASTYSNGLTRDRYEINGQPTPVASTAAGGFYLSALTIGVERGWITQSEGYDRARTALQTYYTGTPTEHGYYYHFLNPDGTVSSVPFLEVSSLDTALLMAGALQAGEYFGGEVKTLADSIYRRVEWDWMLDAPTNILRQAWTPQGGFVGYYNSFCEANLLYLLAIGSPTHPIPAESFYSFARPKGNYGGPDFVFTAGGQAFIYQYPQAWFDFRATTDYFGVNWWQNSIEGIRANQRWCAANPGLGYSQHLWGLTASDSPDAVYEAYGAQPAYWQTQDGTIAPTGIGGSVAIAPDLAIPSLKYLYSNYGDTIWKSYGFVDAFNPGMNWVDPYYLGIDQGIILMMIENRRSGMVWQKFMQNQYVINALSQAGFSGYASSAPDVSLENFEDQNFWSPDTTFGWWNIDGGLVYQETNATSPVSEGTTSMRVQYAKNGSAWSYTAGNLSASNPKRNFSNHELLTMKVYGACDILLKLFDQNNSGQDVMTLRSRNPSGWNTLTYDVSGLSIDLSAINNVLFFVDPGNTGSSGTIYFDDIKLENRKPRLVENFEDGNLWSPDTTLGWWDFDGTLVYRRSLLKDPSLGGFGAMKVDFTKSGLAWSYFGGYISSINPARDFSKYTRVTVWVYGTADVLVKLRDRAHNEVDAGVASATNVNGWTKLEFNFSQTATTIDLNDIENILFFVAPGNTSAAGTIYLDDIYLE